MEIIRLVRESIQNLAVRKVRSLLAALGIIFGVASVICMVSISDVARRDVISRIERMGLRNVVVDSVKPEKIRSQEQSSMSASWYAAYGVTRDDLSVLERSLCGPAAQVQHIVDQVVPLRVLTLDVQTEAGIAEVNVVATTPELANISQYGVSEGRFLTAVDEITEAPVCVLGAEAARQLFPLASPIGEVVRIGSSYFRVVGIMVARGQTGATGALSSPDQTVWIPFSASFGRFSTVDQRMTGEGRGGVSMDVNRVVLQTATGIDQETVAAIAGRLLRERHQQDDIAVTVPHSLVREQRQAEQIFRWVMGSLGAISLLVGGIGIMNIMLANMAERRQEIGLRRALGATQFDIARLFLVESTALCIAGGLLGVVVGILLALLVGQLAQWSVVWQPYSFVIGLAVSALTGVIFGTLPAVQAARLDPVVALRSE